jgi:hypothetical protein
VVTSLGNVVDVPTCHIVLVKALFWPLSINVQVHYLIEETRCFMFIMKTFLPLINLVSSFLPCHTLQVVIMSLKETCVVEHKIKCSHIFLKSTFSNETNQWQEQI